MKKLDKDIQKIKNIIEQEKINPPEYLKNIVISSAQKQVKTARKYNILKYAAVILLLLGFALSLLIISPKNQQYEITQTQPRKPIYTITHSKSNDLLIKKYHINKPKLLLENKTANTNKKLNIKPKATITENKTSLNTEQIKRIEPKKITFAVYSRCEIANYEVKFPVDVPKKQKTSANLKRILPNPLALFYRSHNKNGKKHTK